MSCIIVLDCLPAERTAIMAKHLSLSERALIERALVLGKSFSEIAASLERSPSTISREVKNHRVFVSRWRDDKMTAYPTTAALREISALQKPSIPASTAASSAGNMTAGSCVLPISLPIVWSWRNRLMSVPDVQSRSPARRIMLTTRLTEPTRPTRRSSGMPESGSAQIPNV